jgi:hypothetical protein
MLLSWRIAVNHIRNEAHQPALTSWLRAGGARPNPPPWPVKTRRSRRYRPIKFRAGPRTTKSGPTQNSNGKYTTPYASNIRSGLSRTAIVLSAIATKGDSPNCLPYLLRAERAGSNPKRLAIARSRCLIRSAVELPTLAAFLSPHIMIHALAPGPDQFASCHHFIVVGGME